LWIVICATKRQLKKLAKARKWEADGTFSIVPKPFHQLLGIHTTIRKKGNVKSVPLLFDLMSCRTTIAYVKLLRIVAELINPYSPHGSLQLLEVSLDFESAAWKGFLRVLPGIEIHGCCFHFYQAIFRKIQKLGLSKFYCNNPRIRRLCMKLMSLNLLPHRFIRSSFNNLKSQARGALTIALFNYVEKYWIKHAIWKPKMWSSFNVAIRTVLDTDT
jgi:hypothetical protein